MTYPYRLASSSAKWADARTDQFGRRRARKRIKAMDRNEMPEHETLVWDSFYSSDELYPGERFPMFFDEPMTVVRFGLARTG